MSDATFYPHGWYVRSIGKPADSDLMDEMLSALKMVRDKNGSNPHFPAKCMTAVNAAIAKAG